MNNFNMFAQWSLAIGMLKIWNAQSIARCALAWTVARCRTNPL